MRIGFTGGRDYSNELLVSQVVQLFWEAEVHVGDCPTGLDKMVRFRRYEFDYPCFVHKADWDKHGRAAGPIRNKELIDSIEFLIAFPGGKGTANCIAQAREAGVFVWRVEE